MNDTTTVLRRRPGPRSWLALGAAAAAVLAMLVLIAVACQAANRSDDDASAPPATSTPDGSPGAAGDAGDGGPAGGGEDGRGQDGSGSDGGQDGGGPDGGGQDATPPPGPRVEYFRVAQQPSCPGGTDQFPVEGSPVVLEWRVTGTDEVTLSVDGGGIYDTYPAEGTDTINFPCEGLEGDLQRHTYLLTATDPDGTTTQDVLVVEATVHVRTQA